MVKKRRGIPLALVGSEHLKSSVFYYETWICSFKCEECSNAPLENLNINQNKLFLFFRYQQVVFVVSTYLTIDCVRQKYLYWIVILIGTTYQQSLSENRVPKSFYRYQYNVQLSMIEQ